MKVYLYSRVSTSAQTLEQQERTVYEWLKSHKMTVDEVVSDEGISGGVSYADRNLGKVLLPKTKEGDMIIVSEVSRLGRSMYDLSKLIHDELKPRKLRLVIVGMGIDLNCANITPIDQLIFSNFSFAAELEKHLIRERTLSALAVKKKNGVRLGGSNEKWQQSFKAKTKEQRNEEYIKRGLARNRKFLDGREVQVFLKIIKRVFIDACIEDDMNLWNWKEINTKGNNKTRMLSLMKDYKELDSSGEVFSKWDFNDDIVKLQVKLSSMIKTVRNSVRYKDKDKSFIGL